MILAYVGPGIGFGATLVGGLLAALAIIVGLILLIARVGRPKDT